MATLNNRFPCVEGGVTTYKHNDGPLAVALLQTHHSSLEILTIFFRNDLPIP